MEHDNYSLYPPLITTKSPEQDLQSNNLRTLKSKQKQKDCSESSKHGEADCMGMVSILGFFFSLLSNGIGSLSVFCQISE